LPIDRLSGGTNTEVDVRNRVHAILSGMYPHGICVERRRDARYPYPHLVYLTPTADDGVTPVGEPIVVAGKHLAERGLSFYHREPIPHRRMIASLDAGPGRWLAMLIDLSWCRFTKVGWYESGGRFLQVVPSPVKQTR
jgi:hypothetical protein